MSIHEAALLDQLERIADSLEAIQENIRRVAEPTDEEIQARVEKTLAMALMMGGPKPDDPLN